MVNFSVIIVFAIAMGGSVMTFETTDSVSTLFKEFVVGVTSFSVENQTVPNSDQSETNGLIMTKMDLHKVRQLQQWIGQFAEKTVAEDGIYAGIYLCQSKIEDKIRAMSLSDGISVPLIDSTKRKINKLEQKHEFLQLLFSFGSILSAEIGGPKRTANENSNYLRSLLKAYECVGEQMQQTEKIEDERNKPAEDHNSIWAKIRNMTKSSNSTDQKHSIPNFGIKIEHSMEQINEVKNIFLENYSAADQSQHHHANIGKFMLLKALSSEEMSPFDLMKLSKFHYYNHRNPLNKTMLQKHRLTIKTFDKDPIQHRRISSFLLLHLFGPNALTQIQSFDWMGNLPSRMNSVLKVFTRNLLQRVANDGNSEFRKDYFAELNSVHQNDIIEDAKNLFDEITEKTLQKVTEEETKGSGTELEVLLKSQNVFAHYDKAIRIDWNIWKETTRQINFVIGKAKKKKQLKEYFENNEFQNAMAIISAKFNEADNLGEEVKKTLKVNEFCRNLELLIPRCKSEMGRYEKEIIPYKMELYAIKREYFNKSFKLAEIFMRNFGGKLLKRNDGKDKIIFGFEMAKEMLEKLNNLSKNGILKISKENQQKEFECRRKGDLPNFKELIKAILSKENAKELMNLIDSIDQQKLANLTPINTNENDELVKEIRQKMHPAISAHLFHVLFSFAVRLEALVQGKNEDGIIEEKIGEEPKDRIRTFFGVLNCFLVPEWSKEFSVFDYFMEMSIFTEVEYNPKIEIHTKILQDDANGRNPARQSSKGSFKLLNSLNRQPFSVYETTKMLGILHQHINEVYSHKKKHKSEKTMPKTFKEIMVWQMNLGFKVLNDVKEHDFDWLNKIVSKQLFEACENLRLHKYFLTNLKMMLNENEIDWTNYIRYTKFGKNQEKIAIECNKLESLKWEHVNKGENSNCSSLSRSRYLKNVLSNIIRYELAIDFQFAPWKDAHDMMDDFLISHKKTIFYEENLSDKLFIRKTTKFVAKIFDQLIPEIEALIGTKKVRFDLELVYELRKMINTIEKLLWGLEIAEKEDQRESKIGKIEKELKKKMEKAKGIVEKIMEMFEEQKNAFGKEMEEEEAMPNEE